MTSKAHLSALTMAALALGCQVASAQSSVGCGALDNAYGPFDYTNPSHFADKLPIVEKAHFDTGVESLVGHQRKSNGFATLPQDLDYTLRAFPNHHRALYSMMRYYLEKVSKGSSKMNYSADCYFDRAIRMASQDATVRMIHGIYLYKTGKPADAIEQYEVALNLAPGSAEVHYNAGLMYLNVDREGLALAHAEKAYELGYPLNGLKNMLKRRGIWQDPQAASN